MKKLFTLILLLTTCVIGANAATYLISSKATTTGETVTYKNINFTVGTTAFADFNSFLASQIEANSTVYVADGTYSGNATITTQGLTLLGNNAFCDWTVTRSNESTITGTIFVNASNVTINGFKFTEGGRIESSVGTNAAPLSGIKVLYNYFTGSTVKRSTSNPLVEIGCHSYNLHSLSNRRGMGKLYGESDEAYLDFIKKDFKKFDSVVASAINKDFPNLITSQTN